MHRLRTFWLWLGSTLWFVPSTCVLVALLLALGLTGLDVAVGTGWTSRYPLFFGVGSDGARGMLSAIASSMMTVASLTFSLTISTLATASAQYTSRLVRSFMRDRYMLTRRDIPDRLRAQDVTLRVIVRGRSYERFVGLCFDQIRLCSGENVAVLLALLRAFTHAGPQTGEPSRHEVLRRHAERVAQVADQTLQFEYDRAQVRDGLKACLEVACGFSSSWGRRP